MVPKRIKYALCRPTYPGPGAVSVDGGLTGSIWVVPIPSIHPDGS